MPSKLDLNRKGKGARKAELQPMSAFHRTPKSLVQVLNSQLHHRIAACIPDSGALFCQPA